MKKLNSSVGLDARLLGWVLRVMGGTGKHPRSTELLMDQNQAKYLLSLNAYEKTGWWQLKYRGGKPPKMDGEHNGNPC